MSLGLDANKANNTVGNVSVNKVDTDFSDKVIKRLGRPKKKMEEYKTINIAVPVVVLGKMNLAKESFDNSLTVYVNYCIESDLEKNYETYIGLHHAKEILVKKVGPDV